MESKSPIIAKNKERLRRTQSCNGGTNRFLSCFRPVDEPVLSGCKSLRGGLSSSDKEDNTNVLQNQKSFRRRIRASKFLKKVLMEASLAVKSKRRRFDQKLSDKTPNFSLNNHKLSPAGTELRLTEAVTLNPCSLLPRESSALPITISNLQISKEIEGRKYFRRNNGSTKKEGNRCFGPDNGWNWKEKEGKKCFGLFLLVGSLLALILWGKICAIFCTFTWLFFVPYWINNANGEIGVVLPAPEMGMGLDSEEYKKKVIMDGFLERKHSCY